MKIHPATDPVERHGWHLAWPYLSDRPVVLWGVPGQMVWRQGAQVVRIDGWAGPLPELKRDDVHFEAR